MAKASLTLLNGTIVSIEGTTDEIGKLLELYDNGPTKGNEHPEEEPVDYVSIVNLVKNCNDADAIETQILDKSVQIDRVLLPLYIVHEHMNNALGLTSGEISKISSELGIPISQPNASTTLSGGASRYVMGDKAKKKGQAVKYRLSRKGLQYMKGVLGGKKGAE